MNRLATVRVVLLERTPSRRGWWVVAWLGCLLVAAVAVPPTGRPGGPGPVGVAKAGTTALALVAATAVVGYQRASPIVAAGVAWSFVVGGYVATGTWRTTLGGETTLGLVTSALTVDTMPLALVVTAVGYPVGVTAWWLRRRWPLAA